MRGALIITTCCFILVANSLCAQILEELGEYRVLKHLSFFTDSTNLLKIDDIVQLQKATVFKIDPANIHRFQVNNFNHWMFFELQNTKPNNEFILDIPDRYLDHIGLYVFKDDRLYQKFETAGWRVQIVKRPVISVHQAFPVNFKEKGNYKVYLKFHRSAGMAMAVFSLTPRDEFYKRLILEDHISFIVQGALIVLFFLGMSVLAISKDRMYLFYSLQNFTLLLFISSRHGILSFYFLGYSESIAGAKSSFICSLLYSIAHLYFVIKFIGVKKSIGKWIYEGCIFMVLIQFFLLVLLYMDALENSKYYLIYSTILFVTIFNAAIVAVGLYQKIRNARIYVIAELPFFLLVLWNTAGMLYDVPIIWFFAIYGLHVAPLFETIVLSVTLAKRFVGYQKQNVTLFGELNQAQAQIIQTQDDERKRIAQDLHDELGGNLAAIKLALQNMAPENKRVSPLIELIDEASKNSRNIAHNLMPPEFQEAYLPDLLQHYFDRMNYESKVHFNFHHTNFREGVFGKPAELMIYRIMMELSSNIIRHSGAPEATVQLIGYDTFLELMVEDDGKGFTPDEQKGIGLRSIVSRTKFLRGSINIDSTNRGTTVVIKLPY